MTKPIILVTGKNGQLGSELQVLSQVINEFEFVFTDTLELDITNQDKVEEYFKHYRPYACINTAAYTAVDKAETERELAFAINADGVKNLADSCIAFGTRLVHVSTDYVYSGTATEPYKEYEKVDPVNYYGFTKLKGEEAAATNPLTVIIRTSWVYSYVGNNFVKTMMRLMKDRESISVVNDQLGTPTYAADLAEAIVMILKAESFHPGVYHFSNEGNISWFDFAVAIRDIAELNCNVNPIDTAGYPTPAKRPAYSVMSKEKIKTTYNIELKDWKASLRRCIKLLQQIQP